MKKITLQQFIDKVGKEPIANHMGILPHSVYQWQVFMHAPKPVYAFKLIEFSKGLLDWESIYQPYVDNNAQCLKERGWPAQKQNIENRLTVDTLKRVNIKRSTKAKIEKLLK